MPILKQKQEVGIRYSVVKLSSFLDESCRSEQMQTQNH